VAVVALLTNVAFAVLAGEIADQKGRRRLLWIALDLAIALVVGAAIAVVVLSSSSSDATALGRSVAMLAMIAPFLGLIGVLIALILTDLRRRAAFDADWAILVQAATVIIEAAPAADGGTKTCPRCAEPVRAKAAVCRYCGHEFEVSARASPLVSAR